MKQGFVSFRICTAALVATLTIAADGRASDLRCSLKLPSEAQATTLSLSIEGIETKWNLESAEAFNLEIGDTLDGLRNLEMRDNVGFDLSVIEQGWPSILVLFAQTDDGEAPSCVAYFYRAEDQPPPPDDSLDQQIDAIYDAMKKHYGLPIQVDESSQLCAEAKSRFDYLTNMSFQVPAPPLLGGPGTEVQETTATLRMLLNLLTFAQDMEVARDAIYANGCIK